jgi:hypothetical protein
LLQPHSPAAATSTISSWEAAAAAWELAQARQAQHAPTPIDATQRELLLLREWEGGEVAVELYDRASCGATLKDAVQLFRERPHDETAACRF